MAGNSRVTARRAEASGMASDSDFKQYCGVCVYAVRTAGMTLGAEGLPAIGPLALAALDQAPRYALREIREIGTDILTHWSRA